MRRAGEHYTRSKEMVSWLVANKRTRTQDCLKVLKLRAAPLHNAVLHFAESRGGCGQSSPRAPDWRR